MPYTPQVWVNNITPVDDTHMNYIEAGIAAAVPTAAVTASGSNIFASKLVSSDAQPAFRILGSGKQEWGPGGATAVDTNLYRSGGATLQTDSSFVAKTGIWAQRSSGAVVALAAMVTTDTVERFAVKGDGSVLFGPGNAAADTTLYRASAGTLRTDGTLQAVGSLTATQGTSTVVWIGNQGPGGTSGMTFGSTADTNLYRSSAGTLRTDGDMRVVNDFYARDGNAAGQILLSSSGIYFGTALDTRLYRRVANSLATPGSLWIDQANGGASGALVFGTAGDAYLYRGGASVVASDAALRSYAALQTGLSADTIMRFSVGNDGSIGWGPGGSTARDTNLYRASANLLQTDDSFTVGATLAVTGVSYLNDTIINRKTNLTDVVYWCSTLTDSALRFAIRADGLHYWSDGSTWTVDTTLYRSSAGVLRTDGEFWVGTNVRLLAASSSLIFGGDTNLYRSAAGTLRTDGRIEAAVYLQSGGPLYVGNAGSYADAAHGILFGTNGDTTLYRTGAGGLRAGASLVLDGYLTTGGGGDTSVWFGTAYDTRLYRSAAGMIKTDGDFYGQNVTGANTGQFGFARSATSGVVYVYNSGATVYPSLDILGNGKIEWSNGATIPDTNLYRAAANVLATDSSFRVDAAGTGKVLSFGSAGDTYLYRLGASQLATDGTLKIAGKWAVRSTSTTGRQRIEGGAQSFNPGANSTASVAVTFAEAFTAAPTIAVGIVGPGDASVAQVAYATNITTTGFTLNLRNNAGGSTSCTVHWHAYGSD